MKVCVGKWLRLLTLRRICNLTTCTKYYCNHCGKEFEDRDKVNETQLGRYSELLETGYEYTRGWSTFGRLKKSKKERKIERIFGKVLLGDLCEDCYIQLKVMVREWKKKGKEVEC